MWFSFSMNTTACAALDRGLRRAPRLRVVRGRRRAAAPAASATVAATAAEHEHDAPTPTPAAEAPPDVPVLEQELAYGEGARSNLVGYLAMPQDAAEPLPGIIVIHEWWGLNDNIKAMTRRLAGEGYVALAVDLYGGATAETPEAAQALMSALLDAARRGAQQPEPGLRLPREVRVRAAHREHRLVPRRRLVAADGVAVSRRARRDGHVLRPGRARIARRLAPLNMPMLGFFGAEDESIPVRDVQTFRSHADGARQERRGADRAAASITRSRIRAAGTTTSRPRTRRGRRRSRFSSGI